MVERKTRRQPCTIFSLKIKFTYNLFRWVESGLALEATEGILLDFREQRLVLALQLFVLTFEKCERNGG